MHGKVHHKTLSLDGIDIFYREAGPEDAPVLLLPHGYPCSSYEFRNYMSALADRWRLVAPDFPGSGYSDTAPDFAHDFDGYADFLDRFAHQLGIERFTLYLHDFGSQIGLRLAIRQPKKIDALIIQNGDIYEDTLGPKYAGLKKYWDDPSSENLREIEKAITKEGFREEYLNDVRPDQSALLAPDLWELHWALTTDERRSIYLQVIAALRENRDWFARYQAYLRDYTPPTLIMWGPHDGYMPAAAAKAYLRDLPDAELHLLDGGHWLLETNLGECVELTRAFLERVQEVSARAPQRRSASA